ncbi:MAG: C25 family peptidase propeptide domain-containing protein, partial [Candidatus Cloacimonetes bacterium]|nr:C25 family peptidase propeptide domain-containing protein [Candidatus Cloacimonadota bacterium]
MKSNSLIWLCVIMVFVIPVTLVSQVTSIPQNFSILRSSSNAVSIRFQTPEWSIESVQVKGETLDRVKVLNTPYLFFDETETLPVFSTMIAIPYSGGATLTVVNSSSQIQQNIKADFDETLRSERKKGNYSGSLYPANTVSISDPQVIRDYRVVSINVYPFQYDQDNGKLLVSESIDVQIDFNNYSSVNEISPPLSVSKALENTYRAMILNYEDTLTRDTVYETPIMLVIYGNNADPIYTGKVNEYISWKKQKGFKVFSASTAT